MSVLRGSFLQRRLTKLYTDTKTSYESVSSVSRPNDDPELVALNRNFRTQKDKLLAWGLDWSDANAAQPNDIDEALTEAGFSDVVAGIMSSIQKLLTEAEKLRHPSDMQKSPDGMTKGGGGGGAGGGGGGGATSGVKTTWTNEEIARSKTLLEELTTHIDTLYDLSRSRRNMSMSMGSSTRTVKTSKSRPSLSKPSKSWKDSYYTTEPGDSKSAGSGKAALYHSPDTLQHQQSFSEYPSSGFRAQELEMRSLMSKRSQTAPELHSQPSQQQSFMDSFASTKEFYIDQEALELVNGGLSHSSNPPPYEPVAASANSRMIGRLNINAVPQFLSKNIETDTIPVLVEFSPIMVDVPNSLLFPQKDRLQRVSETLQRLVENSQVSHLALLKFLGYFVDMSYSRYAFIYQIPLEFFPLFRQPYDLSDCKLRPLVSLFPASDDRQNAAVPNLETRFRLAYNLVLAFLHLRSQNIVHGNINSNNVLIFPVPGQSSGDNFSDASTSDFRLVYLTSLAPFESENKHLSPEPLSSSIYRHPDDHRVLNEQTAWAYDMYSLGLVLLEIGLWTPLSRLWKMKYNDAMFKSRIENVYVKKLGPKCGSAYLQMVQLCLDAPNFHLSTEPMADLALRIPQTFSYPWNDPTANDWDSFSKNFVYTIGKISWRCASLDVFSPPPDADLEEYLPPPIINQDVVNSPFEQVGPTGFGRQFDEPAVPVDIADDTAMHGDLKMTQEKGGIGEKKVRKRTLKKWSNIEIPDEHLKQWNLMLMPKLSKLLQKILKDSPESCSATLMIAGETAETAKTTICVTCTNVRKVRAALKKYFDYDRSEWDLMVLRGDVKRSKVPRRKRRKAKPVRTPSATQPDFNPYYQTKPVCGASIGAFRLDEHLPAVSYGGAILVDGMPFGMTVHHMLDSPCDDNDEDDDLPPRSAGNWTLDTEFSEHDFAHTWCEGDLPEPSYALEISDDEDEGDDQSIAQSIDDSYDDYWLSDGYSTDDLEDDYRGDDDDIASIGDTAGIDPGEEPPIVVTQPAIDDVEDEFFPSVEDKDDEHLASHSLGYIHASSGIRRWLRDGIKHEVDWALIKIDDYRMDDSNVIYSGASSSSRSAACGHDASEAARAGGAVALNKVARMEELAGLQVQCCGRTSGLQSGRISKAMTLVKMHGRKSFSTSFSVEGNFGVPGDSGAWVFDKTTGQVCGHVLAWSEKSRMAYIAPMQMLLDDIARTLGATSVILPGSEEALTWQQTAALTHDAISSLNKPLPMPPPAAAVAAAASRRIVPDQQLPIELGKLSLDIDEHARSGSSSRVGTMKGLKDVSTATFRVVAPLMGQSRAVERQFA